MARMAAIPLEKHVPYRIEYPESDGRPVAETELHLEEMVYVWQGLRKHFEAEPDVYVGANMFLYYRQGDPRAVVAPDAFVVKGVPKLPGGQARRTYLLWQEGRVPCFVLETTSSTTHREDRDKKEIYRRLGVEEYFQFDPLGDYLKPRLQGLCLVNGRYRAVPLRPDGSLVSETLGVVFRAEGNRLRLTDAITGELLLRDEEKEAILSEAREEALAERAARLRAEERVRALEEELARLKR
jgi:Uma2 family endonuclease